MPENKSKWNVRQKWPIFILPFCSRTNIPALQSSEGHGFNQTHLGLTLAPILASRKTTVKFITCPTSAIWGSNLNHQFWKFIYKLVDENLELTFFIEATMQVQYSGTQTSPENPIWSQILENGTNGTHAVTAQNKLCAHPRNHKMVRLCPADSMCSVIAITWNEQNIFFWKRLFGWFSPHHSEVTLLLAEN